MIVNDHYRDSLTNWHHPYHHHVINHCVQHGGGWIDWMLNKTVSGERNETTPYAQFAKQLAENATSTFDTSHQIQNRYKELILGEREEFLVRAMKPLLNNQYIQWSPSTIHNQTLVDAVEQQSLLQMDTMAMADKILPLLKDIPYVGQTASYVTRAVGAYMSNLDPWQKVALSFLAAFPQEPIIILVEQVITHYYAIFNSMPTIIQVWCYLCVCIWNWELPSWDVIARQPMNVGSFYGGITFTIIVMTAIFLATYRHSPFVRTVVELTLQIAVKVFGSPISLTKISLNILKRIFTFLKSKFPTVTWQDVLYMLWCFIDFGLVPAFEIFDMMAYGATGIGGEETKEFLEEYSAQPFQLSSEQVIKEPIENAVMRIGSALKSGATSLATKLFPEQEGNFLEKLGEARPEGEEEDSDEEEDNRHVYLPPD